MLTLVLTLAMAAPSRPLPSYPDATRCAGLTMAAAKAAKDTPQFNKLYDAAIFWSLASQEASTKMASRVTPKMVDHDQEEAMATAAAELAAKDPVALKALAQCRAEVPPV